MPDGNISFLRQIKPEDAEKLVDFFYKLSTRTKRLRFHISSKYEPVDKIRKEADLLTNLDENLQRAVIAFSNQYEDEIAGVSRLAKENLSGEGAEFALVVRDDYQRQGIGKCLLDNLLFLAQEMKLKYLTGLVLTENIEFINFIKKSNLVFQFINDNGLLIARIEVADTPDSIFPENRNK